MEQMINTIFNESKASNNILFKDGMVNYYGRILLPEESNQYFDLLMQNTKWQEDDVIIFGKHVTTKKSCMVYMVILNICILIQIQLREKFAIRIIEIKSKSISLFAYKWQDFVQDYILVICFYIK
jgi:hypothetical protein